MTFASPSSSRCFTGGSTRDVPVPSSFFLCLWACPVFRSAPNTGTLTHRHHSDQPIDQPQLSKQDRALSENQATPGDDRLGRKKTLGQTATSESDWVSLVSSEDNCKGTHFSCGFSSAWVGEVFGGLSAQYDEFKYYAVNLPAAVAAGNTQYVYKDATGDKLMPIFEANNVDDDMRVIYRFKQTGTIDHVWLVEQLPRRRGFRVYQSYNGAYSLGAWLATDLTGLFGTEADNKDIVYWDRVRATFSGVMAQGCSIGINQAENITNATCPGLVTMGLEPLFPLLRQWVIYVRDYNETQIINNFRASWDKYGQGTVVPYNGFKSGYLTKLQDLSASIQAATANAALPWTANMHNDWIELFGSPSPMNWPSVPYSLIPASVNGLSGYQLEVTVLKVNGADGGLACCNNGKLLAEAFPTKAVSAVLSCSVSAAGFLAPSTLITLALALTQTLTLASKISI